MQPIYLSYHLNEKTPAYGGEVGLVRLERIRSISNGDTSNNMHFNFPGHIGTHIDFPYHFSDNGKKCKDYPAGFWIFNKVGFINCPIERVAEEIITLPVDIEILILKTGYGLLRQEQEYWSDQPVIPASYAAMLRSRFHSLRVFGFDMISLTSKRERSEGKLAHELFLLEYEILVLEDMNLSELHESPQKLFIAPLLIENADGVPCTVIGFN